MTALTEFQRLEAQGAWRAGPDARLREVIVSVGDATLILSDPKSETPLAHWSLPAVRLLNPGEMPAIYAPGADQGDETLEIDDPLMIDAIGRVDRAIKRRRAHPGRLRGVTGLVAAVVLIGAAALWLPGATIRHAARIAPPAQAQAIGRSILADMTQTTGAACDSATGQQVMAHLAARLLGDGAQIHVLGPPMTGARRLPGGQFALDRSLIELPTAPDAAAAWLLAAALGETPDAALLAALERAGFTDVARLLTTAHLPVRRMAGYGRDLMTAPPPLPDAATLRAALAQRGIGEESVLAALPPGDPLAALLSGTADGVASPAAISGDGAAAPDPATPAPEQPAGPLLTDQQWLALQQICES